jgi:hypothetical protein
VQQCTEQQLIPVLRHFGQSQQQIRKLSAMPLHKFFVQNDLQHEGLRLERKTMGSIKYTNKPFTQMWNRMLSLFAESTESV